MLLQYHNSGKKNAVCVKISVQVIYIIYKLNCIPMTVLAICSGMWTSELLDSQFVLHELCYLLTIVSHHLLPTPTAVSAQSKRAHWCNSHFIHCTKIEVGDSVWGCTRVRHWVSNVWGGSTSPVLHRVTSDHLTRSQCWPTPSDSNLACFIYCYQWHIVSSGLRGIWRQWNKV